MATPIAGPYRPPRPENDPTVTRLEDLPSYPATFSGWIPGLETHDQPLARQWLTIHAADYPLVWFNVRLYDSGLPSIGLPPKDIRLAQMLTAKRIDLLAGIPAAVDLIEFTRETQPDILGRVLAYTVHFPRQFPASTIRRVIIVAPRASDSDIQTITAQRWEFEKLSGYQLL